MENAPQLNENVPQGDEALEAISVGPGPNPVKCPPTDDEIRLCAYYLWLDRVESNLPGSPHLDWIEAEAILWAEYFKSKPTAQS